MTELQKIQKMLTELGALQKVRKSLTECLGARLDNGQPDRETREEVEFLLRQYGLWAADLDEIVETRDRMTDAPTHVDPRGVN